MLANLNHINSFIVASTAVGCKCPTQVNLQLIRRYLLAFFHTPTRLGFFRPSIHVRLCLPLLRFMESALRHIELHITMFLFNFECSASSDSDFYWCWFWELPFSPKAYFAWFIILLPLFCIFYSVILLGRYIYILWSVSSAVIMHLCHRIAFLMFMLWSLFVVSGHSSIM